MINKALFLDRDGVVNFDYGYVHKIKDFNFRPEIFEICRSALDLEFKIIIITNQAGIGRKIYGEKDFKVLNNFMIKEFKKKFITINGVYYCPFHPTEGKGKYLKDSYDRKPNPGMIFKATEDLKINLNKSIMIGDKKSDYYASQSANIKYYVDAKDIDWKYKAIIALKELSE